MYISQGETPEAHLSHIKDVLESGVKFVQLRLKDLPLQTMQNIALEVKTLCNAYQALLSINDHVTLAQSIQAPFIHLGLSDTSVGEVRKILPQIQIGGTANTFEDICQRNEEQVDYIGLGPYRFTKTKEKLSPILGLEGYKNIIQRMALANINIPIYAIGGILKEDIEPLFEVGVYGIAVSGSLSDPIMRSEIIHIIKKHSDVKNSR